MALAPILVTANTWCYLYVLGLFSKQKFRARILVHQFQLLVGLFNNDAVAGQFCVRLNSFKLMFLTII